MRYQNYVYIIEKAEGGLVAEVTADLDARLAEVAAGSVDALVRRPRILHHETVNNPVAALARAQQINAWPDRWKRNLVRRHASSAAKAPVL